MSLGPVLEFAQSLVDAIPEKFARAVLLSGILIFTAGGAWVGNHEVRIRAEEKDTVAAQAVRDLQLRLINDLADEVRGYRKDIVEDARREREYRNPRQPPTPQP